MTQTRCYGGSHRTRTRQGTKRNCGGCTSDSQCGACKRCNNGRCVNANESWQPALSSSCGMVTQTRCYGGSHRTRTRQGTKRNCCTSDSQCGICQTCSNNTCSNISNCCSSDSQCGTCEKCSGNQCVAQANCCTSDSDCTGTCMGCTNNQCQSTQIQCTTGQIKDGSCGCKTKPTPTPMLADCSCHLESNEYITCVADEDSCECVPNDSRGDSIPLGPC